MIWQAGNAQHIGGRSSQQDAFGFSDPSDETFCEHAGLLGVVADGIGGLPNGGAASRKAVSSFLSAYMHKTADEPVLDALWRSLRLASGALQALSATLGDFGTTLLAAVVADASLHWVSVGDSALLLVRDGVVRQLNAAHTHGDQSHLTSFLGAAPPADVDAVTDYALQAGDRVILCSDGLSKVVGPAEAARLALGDPQEASERLVARARGLGGSEQDNVTVLIICIYGPAL